MARKRPSNANRRRGGRNKGGWLINDISLLDSSISLPILVVGILVLLKYLFQKSKESIKSYSSAKTSGDGCYLTFENDTGGRLMLHYVKEGEPAPRNAVGFWSAGRGHEIQDFKFIQGGGKSELIRGIAGGDSNRRKYYHGWCQFIKLAKGMRGRLQIYSVPTQGVEVDIYGFNASRLRPEQFKKNRVIDLARYDAVAVVPKNKNHLQGVKCLKTSTFLEKGSVAGSSTTLR